MIGLGSDKNGLLVMWSGMVFYSLAWSGLDRWMDGQAMVGQHRSSSQSTFSAYKSGLGIIS